MILCVIIRHMQGLTFLVPLHSCIILLPERNTIAIIVSLCKTSRITNAYNLNTDIVNVKKKHYKKYISLHLCKNKGFEHVIIHMIDKKILLYKKKISQLTS